MSRKQAKGRGSTVHYMFRRENKSKIIGGNPRDIKMRSFGKDKQRQMEPLVHSQLHAAAPV